MYMGPHGGHGGPPWGRPYPWMTHLHEIGTGMAATGLGWILGILYLVSALAAIGVSFLLYRGYLVSGDRRLALLALGFGLVAAGSVIDLATGIIVSTSLSWLAYMIGYMVMLTARDVAGRAGAEAYTAAPLALAAWPPAIAPYHYAPVAMVGSVITGMLALAAFLGMPGRLRATGIAVAASHLLEAVALLGILYPGLLVAAVALRATSLAAMMLVLVLAARAPSTGQDSV